MSVLLMLDSVHNDREQLKGLTLEDCENIAMQTNCEPVLAWLTIAQGHTTLKARKANSQRVSEYRYSFVVLLFCTSEWLDSVYLCKWK